LKLTRPRTYLLTMQRFISVIGMGLLLLGAHTALAQPESRSAMLKRQINECMTRRMSADRTLSYNDAMRACKERLQPAKESLASISAADSASKSR
jgi:hypothetical protein